jgi:transcriptional regulator with XRE-family HTH domain
MLREIITLNDNNIGETIRALRMARGMSVKDLASVVTISPSMINRYENGRRTPSLRVFTAIMRALDAEIFFAKR